MASSTWAHSPLARSHAVAVIGAEVLTDRTIPYGTARADQLRKYRMMLVARLVARVCLTAPQTAYLSVILEGLLWHRDIGAYTVYLDLSLPETRRPNICLHSGSGLDGKP